MINSGTKTRCQLLCYMAVATHEIDIDLPLKISTLYHLFVFQNFRQADRQYELSLMYLKNRLNLRVNDINFPFKFAST